MGEKFDLEAAYKLYPKKMGKARGMKKLVRDIQTKEQYDSFVSAILKFTNYHRKKGTEEAYFPHFCTFVNNWEDWLDEDAGKLVLPPRMAPVTQQPQAEVPWTEPPSDIVESHGNMFRKFGIKV